MQGIIITNPTFLRFEAVLCQQILRFEHIILHIRKPNASKEEIEELLLSINPLYYSKIVLHDHHELAIKYKLRGIHINSRNNTIPESYTGTLSRSCHSIEEISQYKSQYDYLFLSPIFNSTSKKGYNSQYNYDQLIHARDHGVIDDKVYALSGITLKNRVKLKEFHFGGYAILGEVWQQATSIESLRKYLNNW